MDDLQRRLMGKRIRDLRQRRGLTQRELAELSGLSESALRSYELGDRFPKERHLDRIARALRVRPEVFEDHDITTVDQVIHALFNLEEQFGLVPNGEGEPAGLTVEMTSVDLAKALRDWGRRREQLDVGEMTSDEYRDWKDAYIPRILIDPVTGEEIDDPYTGRRLEGVEREGARRAVRTMDWLNG
ncbi:MAG: helix-turn-helix transcriptional regulator [Atopobiaceae bacterium]|nr:helix-turn-helix transcriptional regulator [Atopobiaceae bacterium]